MQKLDGSALAGALESLARIESELVGDSGWLAEDGNRQTYVINTFEQVSGTLESMQLALSAARAQSAAAMLSGGENPSGDVVQGEIRALRESLGEELAEETIFQLSPDEVDLLAADVPGDDNDIVSFDLEEAGKCLVFERWTAAMLHIGRALDEALNTLAQRHGIVPLQDWTALMGEVDRHIDTLPADKRISWFEVRILLDEIKALWADPTRRPAARYTMDAARRSFAALSDLVRKLPALPERIAVSA